MSYARKAEAVERSGALKASRQGPNRRLRTRVGRTTSATAEQLGPIAAQRPCRPRSAARRTSCAHAQRERRATPAMTRVVRVLQQEVRRVGATVSPKVDVRVISAANRDCGWRPPQA